MTHKDCQILKSICAGEGDKGLIKSQGTTAKEIMEILDVSRAKISKTMAKFIEEGLVEEGLSIKNSKTYIITSEGMKSLKAIYGVEEE